MKLNIVLIIAVMLAAAATVEAQFQQRLGNNGLFKARALEAEYSSKYESLSNQRSALLNNYERLKAVAAEKLQLVDIDFQKRQARSIDEALGPKQAPIRNRVGLVNE